MNKITIGNQFNGYINEKYIDIRLSSTDIIGKTIDEIITLLTNLLLSIGCTNVIFEKNSYVDNIVPVIRATIKGNITNFTNILTIFVEQYNLTTINELLDQQFIDRNDNLITINTTPTLNIQQLYANIFDRTHKEIITYNEEIKNNNSRLERILTLVYINKNEYKIPTKNIAQKQIFDKRVDNRFLQGKYINDICKNKICRVWLLPEITNQQISSDINNVERNLFKTLEFYEQNINNGNTEYKNDYVNLVKQIKTKHNWETINSAFINKPLIPLRYIVKPFDMSNQEYTFLKNNFPDRNDAVLFADRNELKQKALRKFTDYEIGTLIQLNKDNTIISDMIANNNMDGIINFFENQFKTYKLQLLNNYIENNKERINVISDDFIYQNYSIFNKEIIRKNMKLFKAIFICKVPYDMIYSIIMN